MKRSPVGCCCGFYLFIFFIFFFLFPCSIRPFWGSVTRSCDAAPQSSLKLSFLWVWPFTFSGNKPHQVNNLGSNTRGDRCNWTHRLGKVFVVSITWWSISPPLLQLYLSLRCRRQPGLLLNWFILRVGGFQLGVSMFEWPSAAIWSGFYFNCLNFIPCNHLSWNLIRGDSSPLSKFENTSAFNEVRVALFFVLVFLFCFFTHASFRASGF